MGQKILIIGYMLREEKLPEGRDMVPCKYELNHTCILSKLVTFI